MARICEACSTPLDAAGKCVTCEAGAEGLKLVTRSGFASVREMMTLLEEQGLGAEMEKVPAARPEEARNTTPNSSAIGEHFGKDAESPVLWLPDVFGYAWALPQLIQQAGLKYFMTIKIGWSQYNRLPYDTFLWQGIDGTQILTHFSTVMEFGSPYFSTYNSMANASEALGAWSNFQQKELHKDLLMAYGYGDGGGGPTREMLENIEVMKNFPGLPQVKQSSAKAFFEAISPLSDSKMMPVWNGELYLEYQYPGRSQGTNGGRHYLLYC